VPLRRSLGSLQPERCSPRARAGVESRQALDAGAVCGDPRVGGGRCWDLMSFPHLHGQIARYDRSRTMVRSRCRRSARNSPSHTTPRRSARTISWRSVASARPELSVIVRVIPHVALAAGDAAGREDRLDFGVRGQASPAFPGSPHLIVYSAQMGTAERAHARSLRDDQRIIG
jgi:hypothetical protein